MNFPIKLNCAVILSCAIFFSCSSNSQKTDELDSQNTIQHDSLELESKEDKNSEKIPEKFANSMKAELICANSFDENENPKSDVSVILNGKR